MKQASIKGSIGFFTVLLIAVIVASFLNLNQASSFGEKNSEPWQITAKLFGQDEKNSQTYIDNKFQVGNSKESIELILVKEGHGKPVRGDIQESGSFTMYYHFPWKHGSELLITAIYSKQNMLEKKLLVSRIDHIH